MKSRKISFLAQLDEKLIIEVEGDYTPAYHGGWEDPPEPATFEYTEVYVIVGSVAGLLQHIDDYVEKPIFEWLEDLCGENYSENENPNE